MPERRPKVTKDDRMKMDYCADVVCENGGTCDQRTGKCRVNKWLNLKFKLSFN